MPRRRAEATAAGLLSTWTDSDTAMQIVGTSLGIFGAGLLEPSTVLFDETPLRNALFDILLSLVEGGALDMRPTDDGRYAFRWRADFAIAGLSAHTSTTIDVDAPSPHAAELARMKRERDDALGRAEFAEGLAAERERLLRRADVPSPTVPAAKRRTTREARVAVAGLDPEDQSVLDVLFASSRSTDEKIAAESDPDEIDIREPEPEREPVQPVAKSAPRPAPRSRSSARASARPDTDVIARDTPGPDEPDESPPDVHEVDQIPADPVEPDDADPSEILYLTRPVPAAWATPPLPTPDAEPDAPPNDDLDDGSQPRRPKWSGYTLDKSQSHLSSVERLVDEA